MTNKRPWDTDCDATRAGMERMMRALVVVGGHFTDSFSLRPVAGPARGVSVFFRVWIPAGRENDFKLLAKAELQEPPRGNLGMCFTGEGEPVP